MSLSASLPPVAAAPSVNLIDVLDRLEAALMAMLTGGAEAQIRHLVVVERLCLLGREGFPGDNLITDGFVGIATRAPVIAGVMMVPEGLRERTFSESIRLIEALRVHLAAREVA